LVALTLEKSITSKNKMIEKSNFSQVSNFAVSEVKMPKFAETEVQTAPLLSRNLI
jgi:hypothetical protein